jgi:periplasmic divalent cation tolerance protein
MAGGAMDTAPRAIVVLITVGTEDEAYSIGRALVEERLAACANILPGVRSLYRWEGKTHDDAEVLVIVKTRASLFPQLARRVKELHSYEVPEIIGLPIGAGDDAYLDWIRAATEEDTAAEAPAS